MTERHPYLLRRRMHLDTFARVCGYFSGDWNVNNGYACLHPENEEKYDGDPVARCYTFSCPLAYEAEPIGETDEVVTYRRTPDIPPLVVPRCV